MNWLLRACGSTIGKKLVMGVTGLALCGFLAVHLAGNLLLYAGEESYNAYAHALHAQKILLPIAEVGLLLMFVGHLALAVSTRRQNDAARPVDYAVRQSKREEGPFVAPPSAVMFGTGVIVLLFLLLHLSDFRFGLRNKALVAGQEPFRKAVLLLRDPLTAVVYVAGSLVLGYHVWHGFASAFQSLGLRHTKYTPTIERLSLVFALVVAAGFGSFPLWAWLFKS